MDVHDPNGRISAHYSIPSGSAFARHGGRGKPCTFVAKQSGTTSDGQAFVEGQTVSSQNWIYRETYPLLGQAPPHTTTPSGGSLANATRLFSIFCDRVTFYQQLGSISVSATDPFLNPRPQVTNLYQQLQLTRPAIQRDPIIDQWGGLITRHPTNIQIQPDAWLPTTSNAVHYRGWTLYLTATPDTLTYTINFTPNPDKPSPAQNLTLTCTTNGTIPPPVELPTPSPPGANGPCSWTPPGPGTVTITPTVTYDVTLWANNYTDPQPPYLWVGPSVTINTGELSTVNVNES